MDLEILPEKVKGKTIVKVAFSQKFVQNQSLINKNQDTHFSSCSSNFLSQGEKKA